MADSKKKKAKADTPFLRLKAQVQEARKPVKKKKAE